MATTFTKGTNTRLLCGVGVADSAVTITGIATDDTLMSVIMVTNETSLGVIGSVSDVSGSATISAANTVTVSGTAVDSTQLIQVLFADYDASV